MIFSEIASRFRRAVRNGTRLHLDEEHVKALLEAGFYEWVAARENEEMIGAHPTTTADDELNRAAPSGMLPEQTTRVGNEVIARAARRRVVAAKEELRRKRLKSPS